MFRLQADSWRSGHADVAGLIGFHAGAEVTDTPSWITVACKRRSPAVTPRKGSKVSISRPFAVILSVRFVLLTRLVERKRAKNGGISERLIAKLFVTTL